MKRTGLAITILILGLVGIFLVMMLAIESSTAYWNQQTAQNAVNAAAVAGIQALAELSRSSTAACGVTPDQPVLEQIALYASLNMLPGDTRNLEVTAYYLFRSASSPYTDLLNPQTGRAWRVGDTGTLPCADISALHVELRYVQPTFLARIAGIEEAEVQVTAAAAWQDQDWCTRFVIYGLDQRSYPPPVSIAGSALAITGGIHSSGGLRLTSSDDAISLEPGSPVEYGEGREVRIDFDKISGGPNPEALDRGVREVPAAGQPIENLYVFEEFQPGGFIWQQAAADGRAFQAAGAIDAAFIEATGDGLYVTEESINLSGLAARPEGGPWRLTLIAAGPISTGDSPLTALDIRPYTNGVLALTASTSTVPGAVALAIEQTQLSGLIAAIGGRIDIDASQSSSINGILLSQQIHIQSAASAIQHHPEYCPPNPPQVWLLEDPVTYQHDAQSSAG